MNPIVLTTRDSTTTTATLNRPDERNALNAELLAQLAAALATAECDPTQRIFVLRGAGRLFCSGLDLAEAAQPGRAEISATLTAAVLRALATSRLVTIAAVQGAAIAGGAGLMSACDFAIATRDAKFGYPEIRRGIVPELIMTFLRRQLHERDARELLLLGKLIDASRALAMGLLNRVVADEAALDTEVRTLASSILQGAPDASAETKKLLIELWPAPLAADLERALANHRVSSDTPEVREGVAAFREKRAPNWAHGRAASARHRRTEKAD